MGGAKNCPETPRQKMIGMMYLVLTAMLALNVSTDILNGFKLVDNSLHFTIDATDQRNSEMMAQFAAARDDNPQKVGEWYDKAVYLKQEADSLYNYLEDFKYQIAVLADGEKKVNASIEKGERVGVANIDARDNLDKTAQYAINGGNGTILKEKFEKYRELLIQLSDNKKRAEFESMFSTEGGTTNDGAPISWEEVIFEGMPVGASITILTKMQNDVRSAESEMIQFLMTSVGANDYNANKLQAFVIPQSTYIMRGGQYSAQIIVSAIDTTARPAIFVNGNKLDSTGVYRTNCGTTGVFKYRGEVKLKSGENGEEQLLPFESEYTVGEPSATLSNVELNVVYYGYENKFSISVPGVPNDKVSVSAAGANVSKKGSQYIVKPTIDKGKITLSVQAEIDGRKISMGSQDYRIMPLPRPEAFLQSGDRLYAEGKISPNVLLKDGNKVVASFGPDGLLEIKYTIKAFKIQDPSGVLIPVEGDKFNKKQIDAIRKLRPNQPCNIVDIKAVGPDGRTVTLRSINLTMQ